MLHTCTARSAPFIRPRKSGEPTLTADALDTLKQTGELLPGCVPVGEREHFSVWFNAGERFGHASMTGKDAGISDE
jgi:hypothetical protein